MLWLHAFQPPPPFFSLLFSLLFFAASLVSVMSLVDYLMFDSHLSLYWKILIVYLRTTLNINSVVKLFGILDSCFHFLKHKKAMPSLFS